MKTIRFSIFCALTVAVLPARAQIAATVSSAPRPGTTGGGGSYQPVLSPNGRFVAFVSQANNLVTNDNLAPYLDVFLRDRTAGTISLVNVSTNGAGGGDDNSIGASISADGRFVAFQSAAGNLAQGDTNGLSDVFLRDMVAGTTVLVSRELTGRTAIGRASMSPMLSTNGRWLVFESTAANLVANDTNNASDVFLFDREAGTNLLVSLNDAGNGSGAGLSGSPAVTPDGSRVAYVKAGTVFVSVPLSHVFVRDLQAGMTIWASTNVPAELPGYLGTLNPVLSADGSAVFFHAFSASLTNLYRFDLASGTLALVSTSTQAGSAGAPSANGRFVAYEATNHVFVWDSQSGDRTLVNVDTGGKPAPATAAPARPAISTDGAKVCFLSNARDLTVEPTNGLMQLYLRDLPAGSTRLLSGDTNGATSGDLSAIAPSMSADGSMVAFESTSSTMVADDLNLAPDVFVREIADGSIALISVHDGALPSATAPALATLYPNAISADGRYAAYGSLDNGQFPGDTNGVRDLFVRDLVNGTVKPASVSATGAFTNTFHSLNCVLSGDGRCVAYVLSTPGFLSASAIFWRDLAAGETRVVSEPPGSGGWMASVAPAISTDGRWVAFQTTKPAFAFEPGITDVNSASDVILHDALAGTNIVISRSSANAASTDTGASTAPVLSRDGRWLAYFNNTPGSNPGLHLYVRDLHSNVTTRVNQALPKLSPSLTPGCEADATFSGDSRQLAFTFLNPTQPAERNNEVFVYNLLQRTGAVVCVSCRRPAVSAEGRFVVAQTRNSFLPSSIVLYDRESSATNLISGAEFNAKASRHEFSYSPVIGGDARFVVFSRRATSVEPADADGWPALFVRDRIRAATMAVARGVFSDAGHGPSYSPVMAADGRTGVFSSFARDLVSGDYNDRRDVFVVHLGRPDTDDDGLDDDWEVVFFNNLARNGNGDFDQDGQSDRQEYLSGTDPTNTGSVLRAMTITSLSGTSVRVIWEAVPGHNYQVQYKDNVGEEWKTLAGQVTATSGTAFTVDSSNPLPAQRFYRVVLAL